MKSLAKIIIFAGYLFTTWVLLTSKTELDAIKNAALALISFYGLMKLTEEET